jgi:hypothetical protein
MKKTIIFSLLMNCLLVMPAFAESNKEITLSDLPALVKASAREHFLPENIRQVKLIKDKETTQYQVSGQIEGVQTDMTFNKTGFVTAITQTFQQAKPINCTDVKLPVLTEGEQYYFQVEGVIQAKPLVRCKPGNAK